MQPPNLGDRGRAHLTPRMSVAAKLQLDTAFCGEEKERKERGGCQDPPPSPPTPNPSPTSSEGCTRASVTACSSVALRTASWAGHSTLPSSRTRT